jgi:hypothetical protein
LRRYDVTGEFNASDKTLEKFAGEKKKVICILICFENLFLQAVNYKQKN